MLEFAIEAELEGDCELEAPDPDGRNDDDKVESLPLVSLSRFSSHEEPSCPHVALRVFPTHRLVCVLSI